MIYSLSRNRSSVPPGGCTRNYLSQKEPLSASPYLDTTCAPLVSPTATTSSAERSFLLVAGTGICGVQTPMSSDRSVGSKRVRWNHPLGYMGTCIILCTAIGTSNTDLLSHSGTFSGGVRNCIGWRFACVDRLVQSPPNNAEAFDSVIEVQAFLVTLIRKFDVSLTDKQPQIRGVGSGMPIPLVHGEEHKGSQLPLKIATIGNE